MTILRTLTPQVVRASQRRKNVKINECKNGQKMVKINKMLKYSFKKRDSQRRVLRFRHKNEDTGGYKKRLHMNAVCIASVTQIEKLMMAPYKGTFAYTGSKLRTKKRMAKTIPSPPLPPPPSNAFFSSFLPCLRVVLDFIGK